MRRRMLCTFFLAGCLPAMATATTFTFFGEDLTTDQKVDPNGMPALERQAFLDRLVGVGNESFEAFALGAKPPLILSFPGTGVSIDVELTSTVNSGSVKNQLTEGRFPTSGTQFFESRQFEVVFSHPVSAFGFYATDAGDYGAGLQLAFLNGNTPTFSVDVPLTTGVLESTDAALIFFGLISLDAPFTRVQFLNVPNPNQPLSPFDAFGFDDFIIADREQILPDPDPDPTRRGSGARGPGAPDGRGPPPLRRDAPATDVDKGRWRALASLLSWFTRPYVRPAAIRCCRRTVGLGAPAGLSS